jgi:hypothetical protein
LTRFLIKIKENAVVLSKKTIFLFVGIFALFILWRNDRILADADSNYVRLEVRGQLVRDGTGYAVESNDSLFPQAKLLVELERSEDKNRFLDRRLEALQNKTVVARGFLDCRRVPDREGAVFHLCLSDEKQIAMVSD